MFGALARSLAKLFIFKAALVETNWTAAGSGDATEVNGISIDLNALATRAEGCVFAFWVRTANTADKVVAVTNTIQFSANDSDWTDVTVANGCGVDAADIALGSISGTGTILGVLKHELDLTRLPVSARYIRCQTTPNSSASGTDTGTMTGICMFGGLQETPQS